MPKKNDNIVGRPEGIAGGGGQTARPGGLPQGTDEQMTGNRDAQAPKPSDRLPAAGPHADPALMNPDATPGTGALPLPGEHDDSDSASS
jgi:hypothetical protein